MKEKYKHLLNFVANVLTLAMEALCFGWVWYVMYVPQLDKANTFFRRGNCMYCSCSFLQKYLEDTGSDI